MKSKIIIFCLLTLNVASALPAKQKTNNETSFRKGYCPDMMYFRKSCIKLA